MALSLIKRPIGHKLSVTAQSGTAYDIAGDLGIYTGTAHGLTDGDYVYIDSNIDAYNGFRYVDSVAYDTFKLKESENGAYIQFKQAVEITFYISVLNHYWQCVHLPIVYELESDISPNNVGEESYNPNTVVSFSDNAGYVQLNLAEALSDPEELTKIELVGGTMAGVYQILTVLAPWSVVIDLVYSASYSFSGSVVVKYYDNYAVNVNVYAGFESGHPWESVKPFELAATLKFLPDEDNRVKFSISELLKGYIETRNKLDLDTLPNNTDFMVSFYIAYFETYDQSDGTTVSTFTGDVTTDDIIGYAVNAMLEFKNQNSGHLSDYVSEGNYLAPWLTLFDTPIIIIGQFFDISFINVHPGYDVVITKGGSDYLTITNPGVGVIRVPIEGLSGDTEACIVAYVTGSEILDNSDFQNDPASGPAWTEGSSPTLVMSIGGTSDSTRKDYDFIEGQQYTVTAVLNFSDSASGSIRFSISNSANSIQHQVFQNFDSGQQSTSISFTADSETTRISLRGFLAAGGPVTTTIISITVNIDRLQVTEQICIQVLEECDSTFLGDDLRLTEGDDLRALE